MLILLPGLVTVACGVFAAFIRLTNLRGSAHITRGEVYEETVTFVFLQLFLAPVLAIGLFVTLVAVLMMFG